MSAPKQILVVDDDSANARLLSDMLLSLGHHTEIANDGAEALEKVNLGTDMVIADVMMPGMDGYELCRRIRDDKDFSDIPIVFATVLSDRADRLRAVEAGANDFITKPVELLELKLRVTSLLKVKEAQDKLKSHSMNLEVAVQERTESLRVSEARCRQLYEEAKSREELYYSFLSASPDAVIICDMDRKAKYVSPSFTHIFGWPLTEIVGEKIPYVPDTEEEAAITAVKKLINDGHPISDFETRRMCKDGRVLDVSISAARYYDYQDNSAGIVLILHDITERKRMEKALRVSEELFRTVFQTAQDGIFIKDKELKYTHVNPAMLKILGLPGSGVLGKTDEEVFGREFPRNIGTQELRVLGGQTVESEHTMACKERSTTLNLIRFPMRSADGAIVGLCGIARDITDRMRKVADRSIETAPHISHAMQKTLEEVKLVAKTDSIILLLGENGSGKDYLARYLHDNSKRATGPFFNLNCAALTSELAESELFGHEAGAFTGSRGRKRGLFELAEGGTLLLNEIGELSPPVQAKLLTFLDTQSFSRVGGERIVSVNVRLIAATNSDLEEDVLSGKFRKDLFYRLNVFSIRVPPLRERIADLTLLVPNLLLRLGEKMGLTRVPALDPQAMTALGRYDWPGNVRELRNVLERALILCREDTITSDHLTLTERTKDPGISSVKFPLGSLTFANTSMPEVLYQTKHFLVTEALKKSGGSIKGAAALLGVSRESLKHHMRSLGIYGCKPTTNGCKPTTNN
jgi:two-component system, NtrC family, response regulator AtoC